jgi:hexokinase
VATSETLFSLFPYDNIIDKKLTCLVCEVCNAIHSVVETNIGETQGNMLLLCETCSFSHKRKKFVEINEDIFFLLKSEQYTLARMSIFMNKIENGL